MNYDTFSTDPDRPATAAAADTTASLSEQQVAALSADWERRCQELTAENGRLQQLMETQHQEWQQYLQQQQQQQQVSYSSIVRADSHAYWACPIQKICVVLHPVLYYSSTMLNIALFLAHAFCFSAFYFR